MNLRSICGFALIHIWFILNNISFCTVMDSLATSRDSFAIVGSLSKKKKSSFCG